MEYYQPEPDHSQYEGMTFEYGQLTDARYVHALNPQYSGNKYIEALPQPPCPEKIAQVNFRLIPGYQASVKGKTTLQKISEIRRLEDLRVPLPSDPDIWNTIYTCMEASYSRRQELSYALKKAEITVQGEEIKASSALVGDYGSAVIGFNIIGESGSGKTSALRIALDYYPKVIRHTNEDGTKTIQIPYILVTCPPNSNFRILYQDIGRQLDLYLGNPNNECENQIRGNSRSTLGDMLRRVETCIQRYAVGLIVFDEIQQMNFDSAKENSFNALMSLANQTQVAIGVVGTTEAISSITRVEQIARRIGFQIPIDSYKADEEYFNTMFSVISRYQWFDRPIEFTDEMKHEIYMASHGVIAYIILIYITISADYVSRKNHQEVTLSYIRDVLSRRFSTMQKALSQNYENTIKRERELAKAYQKTVAETQGTMDQQTEEEKKAVAAETIGRAPAEMLKETVVSDVNHLFPGTYSDQHIREVYDSVHKKYPEKSDADELTGFVVKKLLSGNTDKRRSPKLKGVKTSNIEANPMLQYVMKDVGDPNDPLK